MILLFYCFLPMIKIFKATSRQYLCLISQNLGIAEQFTSHALKTNCLNENSIIA